MKVSKKIFVVFFLIKSIISSSSEEGKLTKTYSNALNVIVKEYYLKNDMKFDFMIYGKECKTFSYDIITNVIKSNPQIGSIEVKLLKVDSLEKIHIKRSTIFFIESFKQYLDLFSRVRLNNTDLMEFQNIVVYKNKIQKYLPFVLNRTSDIELSATFNYELGLYRSQNKSNQLSLDGYTPWFEKGKECNFSFNTINTFIFRNQSWENYEFSMEEIKHFKGCILTFGNVDNSERKFGFFDNALFELFGSLKNELDFEQKINFDEFHIEVENSANYYHIGYIKFVYVFYEVSLAFVIGLGDEYGNYEKFYLPFDNSIWIWCGIFFGGGFLVIFIIRSLNNRKVAIFVFGNNVNSPAFNILVALFGECQNILPTRNFARYILMLFILFCLIIRSAYQGVQYEMMMTVRTCFILCEILIS